MVARWQKWCVVIRLAVGDKNRKCSVGWTVSFNWSFDLAVAAEEECEGGAFIGCSSWTETQLITHQLFVTDCRLLRDSSLQTVIFHFWCICKWSDICKLAAVHMWHITCPTLHIYHSCTLSLAAYLSCKDIPTPHLPVVAAAALPQYHCMFFQSPCHPRTWALWCSARTAWSAGWPWT